MNNIAQISRGLLCVMLLACAGPPVDVRAAELSRQGEGYVANKDGVKVFFDALSARLNQPVIVSKLAARKQISGEFDLADARALLTRITQQMGLMWYSDGQAIYIYDASEMRHAVVALRSISPAALRHFLQQAQLHDSRYPLRGDPGGHVLYLSGPPVYIELVENAARLLDKEPDGIHEREQAEVIPLSYTFVGDRHYALRGEKVTIPGIATVIERLMRREGRLPVVEPPSPLTSAEALLPAVDTRGEQDAESPLWPVQVIANPSNNSLLVKGSGRQVQFVRNLVHSLDIPKRHVELSLWIIDLEKSDLDQFGINWQGGTRIGQRGGVTLNQGSYSALDGTRFVASILALAKKHRANIVSRPIILTQENVPAIFDNNRTFYTRLLGERSVELREVTYGTMISVLPRFSGDDEVEMVLTIEDGGEVARQHRNPGPDDLPEVGRTHISTVARVPRGKSLLIGGYTRDETRDNRGRLPGLGSIPLIGGLFRHRVDKQANMVRIFLIQPREISAPLQQDAAAFARSIAARSHEGILKDWADNYLASQQ